MKSHLQLLTIFTTLSLISSFPATDPCKWTDPQTNNPYDFSGLYRSDGWKAADISTSSEGNLFNIDFVFNFCKPVPTTCDGKSNLAAYEALEVMGQLTDACEVLGTMDQMDVVVGTTMNNPGVKITYKGGQTCTGSDNAAQNGQSMQATFNIICSNTEEDKFHQMSFNGQTVTKCSPEFFIRHPAGCVGGTYKHNAGIVTWIVLGVVGYIIGMTLYNMKYNNKKGMDAFPHVEYLRNLSGNLKGFPTSVKDFVMQKLKKGQKSGMTTGGFASSQTLKSGSKSAQYTLV